ncbi:MAG: type IV secretion system protein [Rickettsiales bacterium]|nr:type IV secretion system protein [Rickettsiales bacterium]
MFTFFGLTYLMGVSELNQSEIIARVAKIGIIYLFVSPTGWDWFNSLFVRFFKGGSDHLAFLMASSFDTSPELQSAINNADYYDKSILFSSVDRVFGIFFSDAVLKKISALLFASIFGWAYLLIVIMSFVLYVYAVSNAVLLYLTAQIFMSILFTLGPIFFIFILFNQTKEMFDNWLKQLIGFSLQQILILTTLAFFNMLMYEVIKMALGYKICWDEVWTINIITRISLLSFWTISSLPPVNNPQMQTGNIGNPDGIPSIFTILFIWVIASLMNKFIGFMSSVASDISGGISASDLGSGVAQAVGQAKKMASSAASKAYEKTGAKEMVQRLDMAVFDSGKLADQRRDSANRKNKADSQKRSKLEKAAKNAVSDYKKDNVSKLSKMTPEEQQKELNKVREDAINKAGKKMGMDEKEIKRLKDQKGLDKYHGSNVIGAAAQAARQGIGGMISGDSTIMKSMGEKDAKTSFSSSEFKEGAKKLTKEQRDELRKDNKLNIKRSTAGKALRAGAIAKDKINAGIETVGKLRDEEYRKEIANSVKKSVSDTAKSVKDGVKGAGKAAYDGVASAKNTAIEKTSKAGENLANLVSKDEDKRIEARRDIAKSVVAGTANRVAGAAVGTVSAVAATVEAMTTSKAAKEAIAQLEKQGEINKMAKGTNFARPKAEQDKIKATIKANQKQSTPDEMRDIGGQMSAMQELDYLDEQEEAMKDKSTTGRLRKKMSSAAKRQLNVKDSKKAGYRSEAQEKHNDTVDKEIEGLQGYEVSDSLEENEAKSEAADRLVDANVKIGAAQSKKAQKISDKQKLQKEAQKNGGKADTTKLDQEIAEQDAIINEQSEVANEARTEVGENFEKSSIGQSKTTLKVAKNNISGAKEKIESLEAQKERIKNGEEEGDIEEIDNSIKEQNEIVNKNSAVAHRSDVEVKNYNQKVAKLQASKFPSTKSTESTASGRDQGDTDKTGTKDSQDPEQVNRSLPTDIEIVPQEEGEEENPNPDNDGDEGGEATKKSVDNENSGAESLSSNAAENDNNTEDEISPEQQKSYDKLQKRLADRKKNNIKKSFESSKEFEEQLNTTKEQGQQNAKSRLQERLKAKGIQRSKSESDVAQEAGENQENEESENLEPQQEQQERPSSAPPELATQESDVANEENDEESNVASETDVKKETTSPERIKSSLAGIKSKAAAKSKSAAAITTSSDPIESSTTPTNSKTKPSYADHEKQFKKRLKDATAKTDSHNHRPKPNKEE